VRVLVAGAAGVIGRPLAGVLAAAGHEVTASTRSEGRQEQLRAAGAEPVTCDALDAVALEKAVGSVRPEVVVNPADRLAAADQPAPRRPGPGGDQPAAQRGHAQPDGSRGGRRCRACRGAERGLRLRPAAIEQRAGGVYNIVDEEPAPAADWVPAYAAILGARPRRGCHCGWAAC
jgi:NAD(P)-dependent dehydrogenase (short-subunit alcohol dehydrogenase family)